MKVLAFGSINESFHSSLQKIVKINQKHGPFELVLCTGDFLPVDIELPLPVLDFTILFIRGRYQLRPELLDLLRLGLGNFVYLNDSGIYKTAAGFEIAYVGKGAQVDKHVFNRPVDFLISYDFPLGLTIPTATSTDATPAPSVNSNHEKSAMIAHAATMCEPRYHFSTFDEFVELPPFANVKNVSRSTRFIALPSSTAKKQKWFYAFNYTPDQKIEKALPNPYLEASLVSKKRPFDTTLENIIFKDQVVVKKQRKGCLICKSDCIHARVKSIPEGYICRICGIPGHHINDCDQGYTAGRSLRRKRDYGKCWFCLSNPDVESHLIVTIVDKVYVAIAKGGINQNHVLLVPVIHYASSRQLERFIDKDALIATQLFDEFAKVKQTFARYMGTLGQVVVEFEVFGGGDQTDRNVRLHHMHIQLVPVNEELEDVLLDQFRKEAEDEGLEISDNLPTDPFWPFCKFGLVGGKVLIASPPLPVDGITIPFNVQIGRLVICNAIGKKDLIDWKKCIVDQPKEVEIVEQLRSKLKFD